MIKAVIFDMYETLISLYYFPVYLGKQAAADIGISEEKFRKTWDPTEIDRSLGKVHFEDVILQILNENGVYSDELFNKITSSRRNNTKTAFEHMNPDIIPMFEELKARGLKIALISNCFFEERDGIVAGPLWKYFDCACLSCELGLRKPDVKIFEHCLRELGLRAEECLYVGDGGSDELETAELVGMNAAQACWYLIDNPRQPAKRKEGFVHLETPLEVCRQVEKY